MQEIQNVTTVEKICCRLVHFFSTCREIKTLVLRTMIQCYSYLCVYNETHVDNESVLVNHYNALFPLALFIEPLDGPFFLALGLHMLLTEFTGIEY